MKNDMKAVATQRLADLEKIIDRGLKNFVEVGNALLEIRDSKLYRNTHKTFGAYCKERWDMSRPRAYQLMDASETVKNLSTMVDILPTRERQVLSTTVDILPTRERQVRPLVKLTPKEQRKAWKEAEKEAGGKRPTARVVKKVADKHKPPKPKSTWEGYIDWPEADLHNVLQIWRRLDAQGFHLFLLRFASQEKNWPMFKKVFLAFVEEERE